MGRSKRTKIEKDTLERIEVPTREMIQLDYDLTKKGNKLLLHKDNLIFDHDVTDKVVKITVRYNYGDELLAEDFANFMSIEAKKYSKHVYPVEKIVVGTDKQRIPELTPDLDPMEAVDMWLANKPLPAGLKKKNIVSIFKDVFSRIDLSKYKRVQAKKFTFVSLGLDNWKCFRGRQKMDLIDGIYSVVGKYKGEVGRSNRSGKSALVSTVPYVLFGHAKASQNRLVNDDQEFGWTFQKVRTEQGNKTLGREVLKKGTASVFVDGKKMNVTDGKEFIHKMIGLNKDDFLNSCFVTEGQLAGLLGESSSTKTEGHIRRWIGIDLWDEVEKELVGLRKINREELVEYFNKRSGLLEIKELGKPKQKEIDELQKQLDEAHGEQKEQISHNARIVVQQDDLEMLEEYEKARGVVKKHKDIEKKLKVLSEEIGPKQELFDKLYEESKEIAREIKPLIDAISDFDGKCPIDSALCPRADDFNSDNKQLEKKITVLEKKREVNGIKSAKLHKELLPLVKEEDDLIRQKGYQDKAIDTVKRLKDKVKKISKKKIGEEIDLSFVEKSIRDLNKEIAEKKHQINVYKEAMKKVIYLTEQIGPLEQEIAYLNYAILISSKRGIPSIQMEGALKEIEQISNEILLRMGAEHRLLVSFEKEIKSRKEEICFDCGLHFALKQKECACGHKRGNAVASELSFKINDKGVIREFNEDSSGGRALLALSFRIALAKYLGLVVLFLDECDYSLDAYFLESFIGMINSLPEIGFKQIFVISHKQRVAESFSRNILITRGKDFSTVKLER